ncbi:MAG: DUF1566 domain-containing protein [Cryomorphaceae bacterium]|nr:DUF1566 domain-containing protein [Cryomorphaceae bacterium]
MTKLKFYLPFVMLLVFSCSSDDDDRPLSVETTQPTSVTHNSITIGGLVSGNPIEEVGVVWRNTPGATIEDQRSTVDNPKEGSFTLTIENLDRNVTYHFRAYAKQGDEVVYGNGVGVTTSNFVIVTMENGQQLMVAPTDNAREVPWGPIGVFVGADSKDDGAENTTTLSAVSNEYIARICAQFTGGGFDDWYLPAENELKAIADNADEVGGILMAGYWSSTEVSSNSARAVNLSSGNASSVPKSSLLNCRCIRRVD